MNNGVTNNENNNQVNNTNPTPTAGKEEIKAAKVYKLDPSNAPKEIPKREVPAWQKPKEEKEKVQEEPKPVIVEKKVVKSSPMAKFLFVIVLLMGAYIGYSYFNNMKIINTIKEQSSPVSTLGEEKELALDSPIVLDLYSKVKTNIREDIAESELNDSMKLYLAFRAIPNDKIFDSTCDGFNDSAMIPFSCNNLTKQTPKTFKKEALLVEYVKLFGENTNINYDKIQIGKNCIGGYQYIESRGEYVQGFCTSQAATIYNANKKLLKAISKESIITLVEEVKYYANEGQALPETLKSGTYIYTFKLDKNYNYNYVSKVLKQED